MFKLIFTIWCLLSFVLPSESLGLDSKSTEECQAFVHRAERRLTRCMARMESGAIETAQGRDARCLQKWLGQVDRGMRKFVDKQGLSAEMCGLDESSVALIEEKVLFANGRSTLEDLVAAVCESPGGSAEGSICTGDSSSSDTEYLCKPADGLLDYSLKEAKLFQPSWYQERSWYYSVIAGDYPMVFMMTLDHNTNDSVSPDEQNCSPRTKRTAFASLEYFTEDGHYDFIFGFNTDVQLPENRHEAFSLSFVDQSILPSALDHDELERRWGLERLAEANATRITTPRGVFTIEDNESIVPQGIAPDSFNRDGAKSKSGAYVTSVLNGVASGEVNGETIPNVYAYLEHVNTVSSGFASTTSTQAPSWACIYMANDDYREASDGKFEKFSFEGCGPWTGKYNAWPKGTLLTTRVNKHDDRPDPKPVRSGFTQPAFSIRPVKQSVADYHSWPFYFLWEKKVPFYENYRVKIDFGDFHFEGETKQVIEKANFAVDAVGMSKTFIQPIKFEDPYGTVGMLEQTHILPKSKSKPTAAELIKAAEEIAIDRLKRVEN